MSYENTQGLGKVISVNDIKYIISSLVHVDDIK